MPAPAYPAITAKSLLSIDVIGAVLSIIWPILFLFALQQAEVAYPWSSPIIIGTMTAGIITLLLFAIHQTHRFRRGADPIFPVRALLTPLPALLILTTFLMGASFLTAVILLPQRFQAVNASSPSRAGVQLLALLLLTPVFSLVGGLATTKPYAPEVLLFLSTAWILIGTALLSTLPTSIGAAAAQYGYMALIGAGFGAISPLTYALLKLGCEEGDLAAATGAMNMGRALGGSVGIAVGAVMYHRRLREGLGAFLNAQEVRLVEQSLDTLGRLEESEVIRARSVFGEAYNAQFRVLITFAGLNVVVAAVLAGLVVRMRRRGELNGFLQTTSGPSEGQRQSETSEPK